MSILIPNLQLKCPDGDRVQTEAAHRPLARDMDCCARLPTQSRLKLTALLKEIDAFDGGIFGRCVTMWLGR